jgi:transcriptional regulator with XRE-family HTH domain
MAQGIGLFRSASIRKVLMKKQTYNPNSAQGSRLPGWEDVNVGALARDIGIHPQHLRQAFTGRKNATLKVLSAAAKGLGIPVEDVVARISTARAKDVERLLNKDEKVSLRARARAERQARQAAKNN